MTVSSPTSVSGRLLPSGDRSHRPPSKRSSRTHPPRWFVLPALAAYALAVLYPSIAGAFYAFTDWGGRRTAEFTGLENFTRLFQDANALSALGNTIVLTIAIVLVQTCLGLALALALSARLKTRNVLRTLFFIPVVLPSIIVSVLWTYMYVPGGPLDTILESMGLGFMVQSWLGDPSIALGSVIATVIWQHVGLTMVIYLAGLERIPVELYEAASVDCVGPWSRFWHITRPLLAPATTIVVTLTLVGALKLFDQVYVMTSGGPGFATETLSLIMYREAFVLGNFGYGTAIALVLTVLVALTAFFQILINRRFEVEE